MGILLVSIINKKTDNTNDLKSLNNLDNYVTVLDVDGNIVSHIPINDKSIETIENTTIQGVVELNRNGYIYIFNGQHFGEYGFEMDEYTSANINNKSQECIDYYTSEKYNTNYIQEGDIIICTGDLKKYSMQDNDLDTKDNPIIVLKEKDYNAMKTEAINGLREAVITVGEYFDITNELYVKYDISDGEYKFPFALKFNITDNTQITGNLKNGKEIKIQYKDLTVPMDELELKAIKVIDT